jgi:periplasmic protein TonB
VYRDDSLIDFVDNRAEKKHTPDYVPDDEKESEYPGGVSKWLRYLNKNLKYPDRAINSKIDGQVRVCFMVDKEGNIINPFITKSVGWSLDDESITIIKGSGQWTPGTKDGKIVKTYKLQPVVYRLE